MAIALLPLLQLPYQNLIGMASLGPLAGFQSQSAGLSWTAAAVALSLLVWAALQVARWGRAAAWIALALAGQACSLQLVWAGQAGREIHLQMFFGWNILLKSYQGVFLLTLMLQAVIVLWGIRARWPEIKSQWNHLMSWNGAVVFLLFEAFAAATIEPEVARALVGTGFAHQALMHVTKMLLGLLILAVGTLNLALAAAAIPEDRWERVTGWWKRLDRRRVPWVLAIWVVAVSSLLAWFPLGRMPHVPDEAGYLFQAKYFSAGLLYLPVPPNVQALNAPFQFVDGDKWYNAVPPGWPLILALGVRAGVPWLVNPLLGGATILLAYAFTRRVYNQQVAEGCALLLAASPWLLFLSASLMAHPLGLVCALSGLLGIERARATGSLTWAAIAGLSIGALLHVRTLEAVIVGVVAGLWWLSAGWRKLRFTALLVTCASGLLMAGLYLAYNRALTGHALSIPMNKYIDQTYYPGANRLGFGRDVGNFGWTGLDPLPGHGPIDVIMNTNQNLYLLNFEAFGWACGSLLFIFALLGWGRMPEDALMWGLLFGTWAWMSLYWFSGGPDFGPRYWYLMILPVAVLTFRGAQALQTRFRNSGVSGPGSRRVWAFVGLASLLGLVNVVPWRGLDKYHNYRGVRPDIRELAREHHFGQSLVFVRGRGWPDYASAAAFNPATLERDAPGPIYARDLGRESRNRLIKYYGNRNVWFIAGPSQTGAGFKLVAGPLAPKDAEAVGSVQP